MSKKICLVSKKPYLKQALSSCGFIFSDSADIVISDHNEYIDVNGQHFKKPVKLEKLIKYIAALGSMPEIIIGEIKINSAQRKVSHNGEEALLTEKELAIILYLYNHSPSTKEELLENVWQYDKSANTTTLESHIYRIRQKLSAIGISDLIMNTAGEYFINPAHK